MKETFQFTVEDEGRRCDGKLFYTNQKNLDNHFPPQYNTMNSMLYIENLKIFSMKFALLLFYSTQRWQHSEGIWCDA